MVEEFRELRASKTNRGHMHICICMHVLIACEHCHCVNIIETPKTSLPERQLSVTALRIEPIRPEAASPSDSARSFTFGACGLVKMS